MTVNAHPTTRKVRIYPSADLKQRFASYFGATRHVYNKAIEFITEASEDHRKAKDEAKEGEKPKSGISSASVRAASVRKNSDIKDGSDDAWLKDVQYLSRIDAADEAFTSYKTNVRQVIEKKKTHFKLRFRTKRNPTQSCYISHTALNPHAHVFFSSQHHNNKESRKAQGKGDMSFFVKRRGWRDYEAYLKQANYHDLKLTCDNDCYYLHVIFDKPSIPTTVKHPEKVVSLDPGVRTFQSAYTPHGMCAKLGDEFARDIKRRYLDKIDRLTSEIKKGSSHAKKSKALGRLRTKVRNSVDNLHKQLVAYLLRHHKKVVVGDFNDKGRACLRNDRIPRSVRRHALVLGHCKFRDHLRYRASLYQDREVIIQNEAYTSKTCGQCGWIKTDLGASKVYRCSQCGYQADRDLHGARNILLRHMASYKNS